MTGVIAADGTLTGVFTDGDLRRILDARVDVHSATVEEVMTKGGKTTTAGQLAVEALNLMETHKISALMFTDDMRKPVGAFNMHMLLKAGVL